MQQFDTRVLFFNSNTHNKIITQLIVSREYIDVVIFWFDNALSILRQYSIFRKLSKTIIGNKDC